MFQTIGVDVLVVMCSDVNVVNIYHPTLTMLSLVNTLATLTLKVALFSAEALVISYFGVRLQFCSKMCWLPVIFVTVNFEFVPCFPWPLTSSIVSCRTGAPMASCWLKTRSWGMLGAIPAPHRRPWTTSLPQPSWSSGVSGNGRQTVQCELYSMCMYVFFSSMTRVYIFLN